MIDSIYGEPAPLWPSAAVVDIQEGRLSISEIANKYGRSVAGVKQLKKKRDLPASVPIRHGPKPRVATDELSKDHISLGIYLVRKRGNESIAAFAAKLGISSQRLSRLEAGRYDITLKDLQVIGTALGSSLVTLNIPGVSYVVQ